MALPVVTVAAGGLPVVQGLSGLPLTEAANLRGLAVTKVAANGLPVVYVTEAGVVVPVGFAKFDSGTATRTTLSNGQLTATHADTIANAGARVLPSQTVGKFYCELRCDVNASTGDGVGILLAAGSYTDLIGIGANCFAIYMGSGNIWANGVATPKTLGVLVATNVIGIAVDLTARLGWMRKGNGLWNADGTANPVTGVAGVAFQAGACAPAVGFGSAPSATSAFTGNFGATAYATAAPSGYGNWPP